MALHGIGISQGRKVGLMTIYSIILSGSEYLRSLGLKFEGHI